MKLKEKKKVNSKARLREDNNKKNTKQIKSKVEGNSIKLFPFIYGFNNHIINYKK